MWEQKVLIETSDSLIVLLRRRLCDIFSSVMLMALLMSGTVLAESNHRLLGLRISSETAPVGGMVQVKVFATAPQAITGGKVIFTADGSVGNFPQVMGVEVFSATGDVSGLGFVDTLGDFTIVFSSPSGGVARVPGLPLIEFTLMVDKAHTIGIDPSSSFTDLAGKTYDVTSNAIQAGAVAVGGTLTLQNVAPGAGLAMQIAGTGFTPDTTVAIDGASIASTAFVSSTLMTVTLAATIEITGKHVRMQNADGQHVDYWCWLHDFISKVSEYPIFPLISTTSAILASFVGAPGFFATLDFQNPGPTPIDVAITSGQVTTTATVPSWSASEVKIGTGAFIAAQSITSSGPIRIVGLEIRQFNISDFFHPVEYAAQQTPMIGSIVSAASLSQGAVAPGEIIAIFGVGEAMASFSPTSATAAGVNGTTVLFDGLSAPILYVSGSQVNAIVPYGVTNRNITNVQVQYNGMVSAAWGVPVTSAAPGIFTLDSSVQGQAAVINEDGTINGPLNPAPLGSFISIYATGEGQTSPAGIDGKPAQEPLPRPLLRVTVIIDGQMVTPQYAGGAPGEVAGVRQVNAQIPSSIQPGNAVPVVLQVGNNSSQTATIAVSAN